MARAALADLLSALYDAALHNADWRMLMGGIAQYLNATSCTLQWRDGDMRVLSPYVATPNVTDELTSAYRSHFGARDQWALTWQQRRVVGVFDGRELSDPARFVEHEFYQDFCRHADVFHMIGAAIRPMSRGDATAVLSVHRPMQAHEFSETELRGLNFLVPHLERALQIRYALAEADLQQRVAFDALSKLKVGVIVLRRDHSIDFLNPVAERILSGGDPLTVRRGCLLARRPEDQSSLRTALSSAIEIAEGRAVHAARLLRFERVAGPALSGIVAPIPAVTSWSSVPAAAVLFLSDPSSRALIPTDVLRSFFGITTAEAHLLAAIVDGERIADYSERKQISSLTAKAQLRALFTKTGVNRQSDLITLISNNAILQLTRKSE